jgi:hypothetical protein
MSEIGDNQFQHFTTPAPKGRQSQWAPMNSLVAMCEELLRLMSLFPKATCDQRDWPSRQYWLQFLLKRILQNTAQDKINL